MQTRQNRVRTVVYLLFGSMLATACVSASIETVAAPPTAPPAELPTTTPVASGGEAAPRWSSPPAMEIDPSKSYEAIFVTEKGEFRARLFPDRAPVTVNNFVFLAKQGFYDDTTFYRVLPGFIAQGGDPTGSGVGGPGYIFEDEFDPELQFDRAGLLAMANRGPNTNGSQFFITFAPTPHLNGIHTIFGEVIEGAELLGNLTLRDPLANPNYLGDELVTVEIIVFDD